METKRHKRLTGTWMKRLTGVLLLVIAVGLSGWGVVNWRWNHRPQPSDEQRPLFQGVTYTREAVRSPRPMVAHIVTIDLNAPGLSFLVTPGDPKLPRPLRARTTSRFLTEFHQQLAINGDFFFPWWSHGFWSYYPHAGDTVDLEGFAASRGIRYATNPLKRKYATLFISRDNRARFEQPSGEVYNAVSGIWLFLRDGRFQHCFEGDRTDLQPRTAVALDRTGRKLLFVIVDGRQPNYSEGITLYDLSALILRHGGYSALNLDGGGSTTLAMEGKDGRPVLLNSPIDKHIPGNERPVANHLGLNALPLP